MHSSVGQASLIHPQNKADTNSYLNYSNNSIGSEMQNDKSMNDSLASSILHDLKSMKLNDTNESMMDKYKSVQMERAIVKSNEFNKQNNSILSKLSYNQWLPSQSPDPLYKPFNYKNDSKEVLWASTQSSPNSTQRDQMKNQFKKSTSTPSNLWESPNLKLSQSALMIKNDSSSSVWYTPPQIQSPAISTGQIWDSPTSSILNHSVESFSSDCAGLLRPQDLSPNDIWGNANKIQSTSGFNSFKADSAVWSNGSPAGKMDSNIFTSTPFKSSAMNGQKEFSKKIAKPTTPPTTANQDTNPASSSCLQLFSDDFINYLNMIN